MKCNTKQSREINKSLIELVVHMKLCATSTKVIFTSLSSLRYGGLGSTVIERGKRQKKERDPPRKEKLC
jgi:hypothetical protein